MEEKITNLQTQLAFQEDTIEQMTKTLVEQSKELYELRQMMKHLQKQLQNLAPAEADMAVDETPPHY